MGLPFKLICQLIHSDDLYSLLLLHFGSDFLGYFLLLSRMNEDR
jgi:hypothetical protein